MRASREAEYTEYVRTRLDWLRRTAYLLCKDAYGADDLVQTAITRLYTHWGKARNASNLDAYTRTTLIRVFLTERSSAQSRSGTRRASGGHLIDNALRYNIPGGRVEVMTRTRNGHAILSVANTGPTVPGGQIQRLLQPFQRLSPDRTGTPGGSGLGLSIVAAIAKAHGAIISACPGNEGGLDIEIIFATPATRHDIPGRASQPALARRLGKLRRKVLGLR